MNAKDKKQLEDDMLTLIKHLMEDENLTKGEAFVVQGFILAITARTKKQSDTVIDNVLGLIQSLKISKEKIEILKKVAERLVFKHGPSNVPSRSIQ
mgnify:FL=1